MEKEVTIESKQIEVNLNYNKDSITQGDTILTIDELLEHLLDKSITSVNCSGDLKDYRGLKLHEYDNAYYLGNEENPYIILLSAKSTDITSCEINSNTKIINSYAFFSCKSLTSIVIPNSVTSIGDDAFFGCRLVEIYNLSSLNINKGSTSNGDIGKYAKVIHTSLEEESNFITIDGFVFIKDNDNKYYLVNYIGTATNLVLPNGIEGNSYEINCCAFIYCSSLTSVVIPPSVTSIGDNAFFSCKSLTSIVIPNSVTSIGDCAFFGCDRLVEIYNLSSLNINKGSTSNGDIGYYAKVIHTSLEEESNFITIDGFVFIKDNDNKYYLVNYIGTATNLVLPNGIEGNSYAINRYAFYKCNSLVSVVIPSSVTSIGDDAFFKCENLEYNEYDNGYYLGSTENPYLALIKAKSTDIITCEIHSNTRFLYADAFSDCSSLQSITIPPNVTSIGSSVFRRCRSLKSVVIPDGVTSVGNSVFIYCSSLTSVVIPPSVTSIGVSVFYDCGNLTNIAIPNSVTSIGEAAFYNCESLTSITIPNSVTRIGEDAFEYCYRLVEIYNLSSINITLDSGNNGHIGYYAKVIHTSLEEQSSFITKDDFQFIKNNENKYYLVGYNGSETDLVLPNDIEGNNYEINRGAFYNCSSLTRITITNGVTSIGESAFYNCGSLTSITIPNRVTSIGEAAFKKCSNLTSIIIPKSVTSIENFAFSECSSLTSVTIGNRVTSIGEAAFEKCSNLTSIIIPKGVSSIGYYAFSECSSLKYNEYDNGYYLGSEENPYLVFIKAKSTDITTCEIHSNTRFLHSGAFGDCNRLASVVIPNGVTSIGDCVFDECSSLTSVVIPNGVMSIGHCAFSGCNSLKSVSIQASITDIGMYFFRNCRSLTNITMPKSVTSIDAGAFQRCDMLKEIFFKGTFVDWSRIEISEPDKELASVTIYYYSKQKPTKRGNYWHYVDGVPTKWELTIK